MDGIDDAFTSNEPHSLHFPNSPNSSVNEESRSVESRYDFCVRHVLQVYPNVDRGQLHSFIDNHTHENSHIIIDHALSAIRSGSIILKVGSNSSKRKHTADEEQHGVNGAVNKRVKVDYANRARPQKGGPDYVELAVSQLHEDFSYVEERFIRAVFTSLGSFYAPTHLFLLAKQREVLRRLHLTAVPPVPNYTKLDKGKRRALEDAEFDCERRWLLEVLANQEKEHAQVLVEDQTSQDQIEVPGDDGRMMECGCCFTEYFSNDMASCPDEHIFCHGCISTHGSNLLLVQRSKIPCMSTEGCESFFSAAALRRAFDEKQFRLWEHLDQRREIAAAGLILEDCPFCEFACVISDDHASVFVCGNTEKCGRESCRGCKKLNHLPKTCQEVRDDEIRGGQHAIAEAMSRALMRNCPKCDKPFIKEDGCNKITCPSCGTLSCYICRKAIAGYDHFDSGQPGQHRVIKTDAKCPLFDGGTDRHNNDVRQAALAALEQVKCNLPNVEQNELQVDLPPSPRKNPSPRRARPIIQGRRWPRYPAMRNNQPIPNILQQAAPLLAFAPQPMLPIGMIHDQPLAPQIAPPEANLPLPVLQQGHLALAHTNNTFQQPHHSQSRQPGSNLVYAPRLAFAPLPPPYHLPAHVPALPPPLPLYSSAMLPPPRHVHDQPQRQPLGLPDLFALPGSTAPPPAQHVNDPRLWNRLQVPGPMSFSEQIPRQSIVEVSPHFNHLYPTHADTTMAASPAPFIFSVPF